jgi:hypothetical protein
VSKVPPDPCPLNDEGAGSTHASPQQAGQAGSLRGWAAVLLAAAALITAVAASFKTIASTIVDTLTIMLN